MEEIDIWKGFDTCCMRGSHVGEKMNKREDEDREKIILNSLKNFIICFKLIEQDYSYLIICLAIYWLK